MISADSHVVEPAEVLTGLADRFGDRAPRIVDHSGQRDVLFVPATGARGLPPARLGIAGYRLDGPLAIDPTRSAKPDPEDPTDPAVAELATRGYDVVPAGIADPVHRLADQDVDGVRAEVLYPSMFFTVFGLPDVDVVSAAFANYNAWLAEYCSVDPARLVQAPLLPMGDPEEALRALGSAVERGVRTACIPCRAPADRPYRDRGYEPIWALAEEARVALAMHVGTSSFAPRAPRPEGVVRASNPIGAYAAAASTIQTTVAELICQGVSARHPDLMFVVSEFNAGWLPNWLERLDQGWLRDRSAADPALDRPPSTYWSTNFHITIEDDRSAVLCRELIGVDTILWANDYPHRDSTWPCSRGVVESLMAGVPDTERHAMTEGNAAALYGI